MEENSSIQDLKSEIARLNIALAEQSRAMNTVCNRKRGLFLEAVLSPFKALGHKLEEMTYLSKLPKIKGMAVVVHVHLYYIDLAPEFVRYLKNIPVPFDLYITTPHEDAAAIRALFQDFPSVAVVQIPNKGRDIGAFLTVLNKIDLRAYDVMIKIHTKKSLGRDTDGKKWRKELISPLIGTQAKATLLLYGFKKRAKLGMVGARKHLTTLGMEQYRLFFELCQRMEIEPYPYYVKGSMFAIRPIALTRLKELGLTIDDMTETMARSDGYIEHAIERVFGSLCAKEALTVKGV